MGTNFLFCLLFLGWTVGPQNVHAWLKASPSPSARVGNPLFLTPLIEAGRLEEAKNLSRVGPLGTTKDVPSHSGFLTVNKAFDSNLFFWFFPAKENVQTAPVVLWLQGGPGGSSLFGLFVEHGPYLVTKDITAELRPFSWARRFSMLYVDNPVGTGFSFTGREEGYARNQSDVARELFEALQQFFTLFHEYSGNDFYVTGESYAGKYVPAIAYAIDTAASPKVKINLKGIAIGDGLVDPVTMMDYGDYLYQVGLVDRNQADYIRQQSSKIISLIVDNRYGEASDAFCSLVLGVHNVTSYFENVTGFRNHYNFLRSKQPSSYNYYATFVRKPDVRNSIHVGGLPFEDMHDIVALHLHDDMTKSVKPWFAALIEKYKTLIYSGQLDVIVAYPLTANFLSTVKWSGAKAFSEARRKIWMTPDGQDVAGYVRQVGNFTEVLVRNSGHILPHDQPEVAYDMITRFIEGKPFAA